MLMCIQGDSSTIVNDYQVRYFKRAEGKSHNITVAGTHAVIDHLPSGVNYAFQVRANTVNGWGAWSNTVWMKGALECCVVYKI